MPAKGPRGVRVLAESRPHPFSEFFAGLRQTRREHYADRQPSPDRRRAVLTMVRDEPIFFPIWLRYYSRHFAAEDIYVLDHGTSDGSTDRPGFVRIPVDHDQVDFEWMVRTVEAHQRELLRTYDVVLVVDVDEIVTPRPEWGTLTEYLDRFDEEWVNCLGYEIIHLRDREPPLDPERPILDQRRYWFASAGYDKPCLATVPQRWKPGFHARRDERLHLDPDLVLVHLHRVDFELALQRHRRWRARRWREEDLQAGRASHNLITEDEEFERWFYERSAAPGDGGELIVEPIPETWRGLF